jgi:hypothetical protein
MAGVSEFSIVAYLRKPGHWSAAIIREARAGIVVGGDKVRSIVTRPSRKPRSQPKSS